MDTETRDTAEMTEQTDEPSAVAPQSRTWRPGAILLGLLLIFFGGLFFLQNTDLLSIDLSRVWQLWPLFIIAAGLSLISVRARLATALMALFIAGMVGLVLLVAFGIVKPGPDNATTTKTVEITGSSTDKKDATISIKDGAGTIVVGSDNTTPLLKASLESNVMKLSQTSRSENGSQNVELIVESGTNKWWGSNFKNDLHVTLGESIPLQLNLNTGATTIDADLTNVNLKGLKLDAGASKIDVKLGNKSDTTDVSVDSGMSTVKLMVPRSSGIRVHTDSGMSTLSSPGLKNISKDVQESDNYNDALKKITIEDHMGMGNLSIEYY